MASHRLLLRDRDLSIRIGQEFLDGKRRLTGKMRIEGQKQRRGFNDEPETDMLPTMNMPFMPFGPSNPPFEVEVVFWQIQGFATTKQPLLKMVHGLPNMLGDQILRLTVLFGILMKHLLIDVVFPRFRMHQGPDHEHLS